MIAESTILHYNLTSDDMTIGMPADYDYYESNEIDKYNEYYEKKIASMNNES